MLTNPALHDGLIHSGKISIEILSAVAAAVAAAAGIVSFDNSPVEVGAQSPDQAIKFDQINVASPVARCSDETWPYYANNCLWVRDRSSGKARAVRFIPIHGMQAPNSAVTAAK
jgi:hypothetical protein